MGFRWAWAPFMTVESGADHQEEFSELKQRPWLEIGNGGDFKG